MSWINELDHAIRDFLAWASTINPWLCLLGVFVLIAVETSLLVGLVVPGEAALLLGVGALGPRWALPLFGVAVLANIIGQSGGYWLGRLVGPGIRRTWVGRKMGEKRWDTAEAIVRGSGGRALITTRFVAFVHAVIPVVVGTLRVPFRRFITLSAIGAALWSATLTVAAVVVGEAARTFGYGWFAIGFTVVGGIVAGTILIRAVRGTNRAVKTPTHDNDSTLVSR